MMGHKEIMECSEVIYKQLVIGCDTIDEMQAVVQFVSMMIQYDRMNETPKEFNGTVPGYGI